MTGVQALSWLGEPRGRRGRLIHRFNKIYFIAFHIGVKVVESEQNKAVSGRCARILFPHRYEKWKVSAK
jgi:hypothetical protein